MNTIHSNAKESVLLIGCQLPHTVEEIYEESMNELAALAKTANGEVKASVIQKRKTIHPSTYLGKGKIEEIAVMEDELEIDVIVFNDELSPSQIRNLSARLEARVIDRTQLILDIFAQRAKSKEGKLQVELAQLKYMLPRLVGQGASLSRLGGGIGTRGPGETKLETDRRHIRRRIDEIKQHLQVIVEHRDRYRERRKRNNIIQVALVGYTNAGKSTLLNRITSAQSFEEDLLFATLDPLTRKLQLPSGYTVLLTDTVGFIQDLPTSLIAAFRSTLEEVREANLLLHVVDASDPNYQQHEETVEKLLTELDVNEVPVLTVYNKEDLLEGTFVSHYGRNDALLISSVKEAHIHKLLESIETKIIEQLVRYDVLIPAEEGKLIAQLQGNTILKKREYDEREDCYHCLGYIDPNSTLYQQLRRFE